MSYHAIMFSPPMLEALRHGAKSQTSRLLEPGSTLHRDKHGTGKVSRARWSLLPPETEWQSVTVDGRPALKHRRLERYLLPAVIPGDVLWVRESYTVGRLDVSGRVRVFYRADGIQDEVHRGKWCSSMFMPLAASRFQLLVTGVSVRKLGVIAGDPEELRAEGCHTPEMFESVWRAANGGRFDLDRWVWTYRFMGTHRRNVFLERGGIPRRFRRVARTLGAAT